MTDATSPDTPSLVTPAPVLANHPAFAGCPAGPAAAAAWEQFVSFASDQYLAPGTRQNYAQGAVQFLDWLQTQAVALTQVTPAVVNEFLAPRHHCRTALRRLFDVLVAHGVVTNSPVADDGRYHRTARPAPPASTEPMAPAAPDSASVPGAREPEPVEVTGETGNAPDEHDSKQAFVRYWDRLIASGKVNAQTGRSRRNVALRYIELWPEEWQRDFRRADLNEAVRRFEAQNTDRFEQLYTLPSYHQRFRKAVTHFLDAATQPGAPARPGVSSPMTHWSFGSVTTWWSDSRGCPVSWTNSKRPNCTALINAYVVEDGAD